MKKMLWCIGLVFLTACQSEVTLPGETVPVSCVGLNTPEAERDSTLVYKLSAQNLVLGIFFVELIVPPVVVALDELWCPVSRRP